jgi:hypothetical protein
MNSKSTFRLGFSVALVLGVCSFGLAQGSVDMPAPIMGPTSMRIQQEAFQVAIRNGQGQRVLEEMRAASPLTYYDSDWRTGILKLANGQEMKAQMRYNLVARALEIHRPGPPARPDTVLLLQQFQAAQFGTTMPGVYREFVAHPYQSEQSRRDYNLFEKISSVPGPVDLLLLHEVIAQTTTSTFSPGGTGRPAEQNIQRVSRLYARMPKRSTVQEISLNKTGVLYLFGRDANRMAAYASAHNLSFTDLEHVVRLVDEYNKTARP